MEIRFFAAAAEAAGTDTVSVPSPGTAAQLIDTLGAGNPRLAQVLAVSSLLADGARVSDLSADLSGIGTVDVLPPFAGG